MDFLTFLRNQWDRVAAWVLIALGGLLLLIGWLGVSDALLPTEQMPYIVSGGLGGICLIGIGVMLWLSADLRDEWSELHEIARRLGSESPTD
jgi:heme A synthase